MSSGWRRVWWLFGVWFAVVFAAVTVASLAPAMPPNGRAVFRMA